MTRRTILIAVSFVVPVGCTDHAATTDPAANMTSSGTSAALSLGASSARYKLRFVFGINPAGDGEIQSDWFPDTGVVLNARNPWKSLAVGGATISLVNFTHGSWAAGTCATFKTTFAINRTNWDIAGTNPTLSFAGTWSGTLSTSQTTGTSVYFDGDRVVSGVVTPSAGGIHNVVSNGNLAIESRDPTGAGDWFQLEVRNAVMKFGSASTSDGTSNPVGVEVACANFTILAEKVSLLNP